MSDSLKELDRLLSTELAYLTAAFCQEAIFSSKSFSATCKYNFALRRRCEEHDVWHVLPARKRRPWRLVSDAEELVLDHLENEPNVVHLPKALWDVRKRHAAYFALLAELEENALKARREQKRLRAKDERSSRQPPMIAAEFIPRTHLIEFATCYRKTQYPTRAAAETALQNNHPHEVERMNVYTCKFCKQHHVGHRPRKQPSPRTLYKHAKKFWREYPQEANRFAKERNLLLG